MYLSEKILRAAFVELKGIDGNDQVRKEKVSQLKYAFAASHLMRKHNVSELDLSPSTGAHRNEFKRAAGELVKLDETGLYTQNFGHMFDKKIDFGSSSNFLTTIARRSGQYPGQRSARGGKPVLELKSKGRKSFAKLAKTFNAALNEDYNLQAVSTALAIWLTRFSPIKTVNNVVKDINTFTSENYESIVSKALEVSQTEFDSFLKRNTFTSDDLFQNTIPNLAGLADEFGDDDNRIDTGDGGAFDIDHDEPINIIFAGPPGTGKSRCAEVLADAIARGKAVPEDLASLQSSPYPKQSSRSVNIFHVQFHASYSYEDFVEGIRPVTVPQAGRSNVIYETVPGILRAAAEVARAFWAFPNYSLELNISYDQDTFWQISSNQTVKLYRLLEYPGVFSYKGRAIATCTPGQSLTTSKIEGLATGIYTLEWKPAEKKVVHVVLTIDEINRGNPSVIFGEALTLLEASKRMGEEEELSLTLQSSGRDFRLPPNLHFLGTMNTSDRSLAVLDSALKRRFRFIYLKPDFSLLDNADPDFPGGAEIIAEVSEHFDAINQSMHDCGVPVDDHIGHSYAFLVLSRIKKSIQEGNSEPAHNILAIELLKVWQSNLHSIVREAVGPMKLEKFCEKFAERIIGSRWLVSENQTDKDLARRIKAFLQDPAADDGWSKIAA